MAAIVDAGLGRRRSVRGATYHGRLDPHRPSLPARRLDPKALHRLVAVTVLGFASGLPLALTGQAMQAWLSADGIDIATIGFLSLVGLPYTFKFLWAPLMDRFEPPWLGRRRSWLVLTQLALAAALFWMAATPPRWSAFNAKRAPSYSCRPLLAFS